MCNEASIRRNMEKSNELLVQVRKPLPLGFYSGNKVISGFFEMLSNLFRRNDGDSEKMVMQIKAPKPKRRIKMVRTFYFSFFCCFKLDILVFHAFRHFS
ncbi:hypothetical protein Hanom_Chr00s148001g01821091 [Helianthus anomalus]